MRALRMVGDWKCCVAASLTPGRPIASKLFLLVPASSSLVARLVAGPPFLRWLRACELFEPSRPLFNTTTRYRKTRPILGSVGRGPNRLPCGTTSAPSRARAHWGLRLMFVAAGIMPKLTQNQRLARPPRPTLPLASGRSFCTTPLGGL